MEPQCGTSGPFFGPVKTDQNRTAWNQGLANSGKVHRQLNCEGCVVRFDCCETIALYQGSLTNGCIANIMAIEHYLFVHPVVPRNGRMK